MPLALYMNQRSKIKNILLLFYRWPWFIFAFSFLILFFQDKRFIPYEIFFLIVMNLAEFLNSLLGRIILGFADNFRHEFTTNPGGNYYVKTFVWLKTDFIRIFLISYMTIIIVLLFGFAVTYYGLYLLTEGFNIPQYQGNLWIVTIKYLITFIYFSIATFATVGYGDIQPTNTWTMLFTIIEIAFSVGILIFLIVALSNTFIPDEDRKK